MNIFGDNNGTAILAIGGPGEAASIMQPGMAMRIPKDAELIFEMHYTPNGVATTDRSKVGLTFAKALPERELKLNPLGTEHFRIPPYDPHHKETAGFTFPKDGHLVALLPHMHVRGKAFQYEATYPDGRQETLAIVPRYDFNWQTNDVLEKPLAMPKGTKVRATAYWDNSRTNPINPDPSKGGEVWLANVLGDDARFSFVCTRRAGGVAVAPQKVQPFRSADVQGDGQKQEWDCGS